MKIAIFIQNPPWVLGAGYETSAFTIAKGLCKLGNEVDMICLRRNKKYEEEFVDGIRVIYSGTKIKTNFPPLDILIDSMTQFLTAHHGIKKKYDIYYYFKGPALKLLKKDAPVVFHAWGVPFYWQYWWSPIAIITNFIDLFTAIKSDNIIAASGYIGGEYKKIGIFNKKTFVSNPGIDVDKFKPTKDVDKILHKLGVKKGEELVVFVGRIVTNKKVDELLEIFSMMQRQRKKLRLAIVGKGPDYYLKHLKGYASKLGISGNVTFCGEISHADMPKVFSSAKLNLFPSHRDTFGLVNIESQACGTPSIAYDIDGVRDSIKNGKTGFLIPVGEKGSFAKKSVSILSSKKAYDKMSKDARLWVSKKFDINKNVIEINNFLISLRRRINEY